LYFTIIAILHKAYTYADVHRFIVVHFETLKKMFKLKWRHPPDESAVRRIIICVSPEEIERVFRQYSMKLTDNSDGIKQICFDGKTLRGSFSRSQRAQRIFEAFSACDSIVLAHIPLDSDKDSEIPALHEFLLSLDLEGVVVTADAMHCQKKNFEIADAKKAIFIAQVKGNQKALLEQAQLNCARKAPIFTHEGEWEKHHGRLEKRDYKVYEADLGYLAREWPFVRRIVAVTRYREKIGREPTLETSYYVSNGGLDDKQYHECIRKHWFIENKNHYVRDATMREDFTVKRRNPVIFATCLSAGLNIMRNIGETNISKATYINCLKCEDTLKRYALLL
jgi:predicted transposase YbfD/YdcC